jgi:hypothetical protein
VTVGASDEEATTEQTAEDFIAAADAICQQNGKEIDKLNPELAKATIGPRDAKVFDQYVAIYSEGTDQLVALGEAPAELLPGWDRYLALQQDRTESLQLLAYAMRDSRVGAINRLSQKSETASIQSARQLRGLGFKECGSAGKQLAKQNKEGVGIGESLQFYGGKLDVTVTVDAVLDPATGGSYEKPTKGSRFVGIQMTIENNGKEPFDASAPDLSSSLITSSGQAADSAVLLDSPDCDSNSFSASIPPGQSLTGCIPYEIPEEETAASFQYSPAVVTTSDPGIWTLE